jgi:Zn-dependent protease with chaperone function
MYLLYIRISGNNKVKISPENQTIIQSSLIITLIFILNLAINITVAIVIGKVLHPIIPIGIFVGAIITTLVVHKYTLALTQIKTTFFNAEKLKKNRIDIFNTVLSNFQAKRTIALHIFNHKESEALSFYDTFNRKKVVIISQNLIKKLSRKELSMVYAHEIAHLQAFDTWQDLLKQICLMSILKNQTYLQKEIRADAIASKHLKYPQALTSVLEKLSPEIVEDSLYHTQGTKNVLKRIKVLNTY